MATFAARRLTPMATARSGLAIVRATPEAGVVVPRDDSPKLAEALAMVRTEAAFWDRDRAFAPDLAAMRRCVEAGAFLPFVGDLFTAG